MTALEWHPPNEPLRAGVLRASVFALLVVAGIAMTVRPWLQLGALYPGKAAAVFAAWMAIAFGYVGSHHPHAQFGPANHVTMIRVMIVALIASLIGEPVNQRAAAAASIATAVMAVLDGVDGWLARRSRMASAFGARFDMETDAALVMAMSVLIWQYGKAGMWALLGGMLRYIFVIAGWWLPWMARPLTADPARQDNHRLSHRGAERGTGALCPRTPERDCGWIDHSRVVLVVCR